MELAIPGLIIVALMVYASTKIKRMSAEAFAAEVVEGDKFVIEKPQGFLHVLNGDPQLAFEAYSKEFGKEHAEKIRQARFELRIDQPSDRDAAETEKALTKRLASTRYGCPFWCR